MEITQNKKDCDGMYIAYSTVLSKNIHTPLRWRHNGHDAVSNHQPHDCLLNRFFGRRTELTSKPRVTGLCVGNSPGTGEFPAQMASNAENVSIWWRHHIGSVIFLHGLYLLSGKTSYRQISRNRDIGWHNNFISLKFDRRLWNLRAIGNV